MSFIKFHTDSAVEVLHLSKDGIRANPDIPVDEAAKAVLAAIDSRIKVMVEKAVAAEREGCITAINNIERHRNWVTREEAIEAIRARGSNHENHN